VEDQQESSFELHNTAVGVGLGVEDSHSMKEEDHWVVEIHLALGI
jgi:hypothetical protein